ncbi:MAG TPA: hypothetical protein VNX27_13415, partial [Chthoniobacterales bacterium]|nr:hypothetical protein [Chthoniobacterales bacterium]
ICFQRIARVNAVVINSHNQRVAATDGQLLLNNWNEFGCRSPVLLAALNADTWNVLEIARDDILLLLPIRKPRNHNDDFVRRPRLFQQTTESWFEVVDPIRQR